MSGNKTLMPAERIANAIFITRGHKIMIDADLARLYGTHSSGQAQRRPIS